MPPRSFLGDGHLQIERSNQSWNSRVWTRVKIPAGEKKIMPDPWNVVAWWKKEMEKNISRVRKVRSLSSADGWRLWRVGWLHDERLIFLQVEGVKVVYVELEFWMWEMECVWWYTCIGRRFGGNLFWYWFKNNLNIYCWLLIWWIIYF